MDEPVRQQLAEARHRLLDLTLRNRLLNFRPTRRTTVEIVDELPAEVWRLVVEQQKKLAFLAREEHELFDRPPQEREPEAESPGRDADAEEDEGPEQPFVLPDLATAVEDGGPLPDRYTDLFLQTSLPGEELQTNLLRIEQEARSLREERGVNLLFLAVGFLHWRPDDQANRDAAAPLVLVPVELERTSAQRRFKLHALDDEPILNPCLRQRLKEFRVELPDAPAEWEGFDVAAYLAAVANAVAPRPDWRVAPSVFLGFFSFLKYLMYVDLDPARWPEGRELTGNPLIRAVCGGQRLDADLTGVPSGRGLDALAPEEVFQVLDADSSQAEAIAAARDGASLVIEGPPGTGKSQTIANIIAGCLADGRTVLFVSEKLAALDVVKRRLDRVGLGDFCLELHSTKATRRAVAAELGRLLEKGPYARAKPPAGAEKLLRLRTRLNEYVAALHEPFGPARVTPYDAIGRAALLADVPDVPAPLDGWEAWDAARLDAMTETLERLGRRLRDVSPLADNPWRGATRTDVSDSAQPRAADLCRRLAEETGACAAAAETLAATLGAPPPGTLGEMHALARAAAALLDTPEPAGRLLGSDLWDEPTDELRAFLSKAGRVAETLRWMDGRYGPGALDAADWAGIHERCRRYWASVLRWLRPAYWSDRGVLKRLRAPGRRPPLAELAPELKRLADTQALTDELSGADEIGTKYFDDAWAGPGTDWPQLTKLADWLTGFRRLVREGTVGPAAVTLAGRGADRSALAAQAEQLDRHLSAWRAAWGDLAGLLAYENADGEARQLAAAPWRQAAECFARMAGQVEALLDWTRYQQALQDCLRGPLGAFAAAAVAANVEPEALALAMEKRHLRLLVEAAFAEREPLGRFNAADHEADVLEFARLDVQWLGETCRRVHGLLASQRPSGALRAAGSSQLGILQGEVRRKRGGRPIRRLLADAADAIRKLKPCFMMSPLSVAQFLEPGGMRFDVVVFDEASQVEPPDALGALARGRQLLLVGDPKQLPPTAFFEVLGPEPGSGGPEGEAGLVDMESILDRGTMVFPSRRLRWHYRSRHDSLIAFSNREFYGDELVTFPSCHARRDELGLSMTYEPSDRYGRGRGQTNRDQARRIAEFVREHARRAGELTLGVGAFSRRQQQAVLDAIEALRRQDDSFEAFFDLSRPEPFFVKNLETIQGDERDVILLSVGYGRDEPGERLSMNFGPLNQDGGWRRLNVLITRARRRCVVFSSIVGEDFDLSATQARGVHALKGYLDFARAGEAATDAAGEAAGTSALEQAVYNALSDQGLTVRRRVGCSGYAVDLAVTDPDGSGRYILGIECDGPTYARYATARDRDRIRRQVLEGLGWRIHRIWATEWFRSPRRELERVLEAVRQARAGLLKPLLLDVAPPPPAVGEQGDGVPEGYRPVEGEIAVPEYEFYASRKARTPEEFYAAAADALATLATRVVDVEGPVHRAEVVRRVCSLYGLSRAGDRIEEKIHRAMSLAVSAGEVSARGEFLWPKGMDEPPVRRRAEAAEAVRDVDLICDEEIARAARLVLEAQFGMARDDLAAQAARLLGFQHAGSKIQQRVGEVVDAETRAGRIAEGDGGTLTVGDSPAR